jgi:hypothetical protein
MREPVIMCCRKHCHAVTTKGATSTSGDIIDSEEEKPRAGKEKDFRKLKTSQVSLTIVALEDELGGEAQYA